jgi:hypothetical protein
MLRTRVGVVLLCLAGLVLSGCGPGPASGPPASGGTDKPPPTSKPVKPPPDERG